MSAPPPIRPVLSSDGQAARARIPASAGGGSEEQIRRIGEVRSSLYRASAQECETLRQAFKAECRLLNVRVNSNTQMRGPSNELVVVSQSSTDEITFRPN